MKKITKELLVGALVLVVVGLVVVFGWLMGTLRPFSEEVNYRVLYAFAGGVEVGSPVRVSGVKVGKVEKIEFLPTGASEPDGGATLRVTLTVSRKASVAVRQDSRFYVNMAGIIGERYIEISPGSESKSVLAPGAIVRGIDPPRIDQLLSQGYGVFGQLQDLISENEESASDFLKQMGAFLKDANKLLNASDRKKLFGLIDNLFEITNDMKSVTKVLTEPETKETFKKIVELINRAHQIDKPTLKKFLQDEGIRAHIF